MNQTVKEKTNPASDMPHRDYVVPPGLVESVLRFGAHYKAASGEPVLIEGPTGVGKTMFIDIFKILYREEHGDKPPIVTVNCSHFEGDLGRSELFGHVKGAFSGAFRDKIGLIKTAHTGLLILEEIGDLPQDMQAKLLTFIETKEYYRVGGVKPQKAKVQILGATNQPEKLRPDFRYRFFRFSIPPLYERRGDVLYYLDAKFHGLLERLRPVEVLALIVYNWPGNVREIDTFGRRLYREKYIRDERDELLPPPRRLSFNEIPEGQISLILDKETREIMFHIQDLIFSLYKIGITESTNDNQKDRYSKQNHNNNSPSYKTSFGYIVRIILQYFFLDPGNFDVSIGELMDEAAVKKRLASQLILYIALYTRFRWPFDTINNIMLNKSQLSYDDTVSIQIKEGVRDKYVTTTTINMKKVISGLFEEMRQGLSIYSALCFQDENENKNLSDFTTGTSLPLNMLDRMHYRRSTYSDSDLQDNLILRPLGNGLTSNGGYDLLSELLSSYNAVDYKKCISQLESKMLELFSEIKLDDNIQSLHSIIGRQKLFLRLMRKYPNNKFLESLVPESMRDTMNWEDEESDELRIPLIPYKQLMDQVKRSYHEKLLKKTNGNGAAAAKIADVPAQSLYTRLRRLKIKFDEIE